MAKKQLTPEQRQKIEQLLADRDKFNEKFWQEQREFEERWAKSKQSPQ